MQALDWFAGKAGAQQYDAAYWAEQTKGFDFSTGDGLDSAAFNLILWNGLKDNSEPNPEELRGRDLRKNRRARLGNAKKSKDPNITKNAASEDAASG